MVSTKTLRIILAIGFLIFGIGKFIAPPEAAAPIFGNIGGSVMQYFTGVYQVISAILVFFPQTAFIGALLMAISMAVALILHFTLIDFLPRFIVLMIVAVVFLVLSIIAMKKTRKDLFKN